MQTPCVPPIPHVGGPIVVPDIPTVLIGNMPAAVVDDMCTCVGQPDSFVKSSVTVLIGGRTAVRMDDLTTHLCSIVRVFPTVMIGG